MKYFGIKDQNGRLICVATEETIEAVKGEAKRIFKNVAEICEVSEEELDAFIEEWSDGGTKLLCHTIVNKRGL